MKAMKVMQVSKAVDQLPSRERLDLPDAIEFGPRLGRKASLYGSPRRQSSPRRQISPSRHFSPSPLKPQPSSIFHGGDFTPQFSRLSQQRIQST